MPTITRAGLTIDFTDEGEGPVVVLLHSSVSGNRQWRALGEHLRPAYRVIAVNLYGYGETTPWTSPSRQTLADHVHLVEVLCEDLAMPIHVVGHSFGGSVALKVAATFGPRVSKLVLLEPNPFYLLKQHARIEAFDEASALRDFVKEHGAAGHWEQVAERFANYWVGDGAWAAMPEKRRTTFLLSLRPNLHEWDAIDDETTPIDEWRRVAADVLVLRARDTRRSVAEIYDLLRATCPAWTYVEIASGGHMAPLSQPDAVNPIIRGFLDAGSASPAVVAARVAASVE